MAEGSGEDLPGEEEWRPIPGFEGLYSVSDKGRVRSEYHVVIRKNGVPFPCRRQLIRAQKCARKANGTGHRMMVRLTDPRGGYGGQYVHHLVLAAFVGPRPDGQIALHWDDDSSNNNIENLRWGTYSDNARDQIRNGGHHYARRSHCKWGHEFTPENTAWRERGHIRSRLCITCDKTRNREECQRRNERDRTARDGRAA